MDDDPLEVLGRAADVNADLRPVAIVDGVVTRPASALTPALFSFFQHLREQGLDCVPEPIEVVDGYERLRLIEGEDGGRGWYHQHTDEGLASAARLLRRIHDAGREWTPPDAVRWTAHPVEGEDLVFCHGDPGPWNFIWQDQEAVGLIDWDYLHPAPRTDDVAYALRWFAPLREDRWVLEWHHFPEVPDRRHRVEVFLEAYGDLPAFDVVDAVATRMQATLDLVHELAVQGVEPQRTWVAEGARDVELAELAWVREHRHLID